MLKIDPKFSLKRYAKLIRPFYKYQADADRIVNALDKAGLPDKPPVAVSEKPSIAVLPFAKTNGTKDPVLK